MMFHATFKTNYHCMKKNLIILIIAIAFFSCNSSQKEYSIKGTIDGVETGKVYLQKLVDGQPQSIDTAELKEGKFEFKGKMEIPDIRFLLLNEQDYFAQFFLDNAKIAVSAKKDSLRATKITGSPTHDIFKLFISEMEKINKDVNELQGKYQEAMSTGNTDEASKIKINYDAIMENNKVYTKNFVKEHSNSVVAPYITLLQLSGQVESDELETITNGFAAELAGSEYVKQLNELIAEQKKTAIGVEAPDFTMNDQDGNPFTLSSLRGKVVLIDFWAAWCGPCRQENPNVVKIYEEFNSKGFEILGVSLDRTREDWIQAIKDDKLTWKHVSDLQYWQNTAARLYGVNSIPQTYLLDKDGKIIAKGLRSDQLKVKLQELFPN